MLRTIEAAASFSAATSWESCFDGATTRNAFAALSGQAALLALDLIDSGFAAPSAGIHSTFGTLLGDETDLGALSRGLGGEAAVADAYFKFHAACALVHPSLDAVAAALGVEPRTGEYPLFLVPEDERPRPAGIREVRLEVPARAARLARLPNGSALSAKFSIPFCAAALIVHGSTGPEIFREPLLSDRRVRDLARKVSVRDCEELTNAWPAKAPARARIVLADGTALEGQCEHPFGSSERAPTSEDLEAKFLALASPVLSTPAARLIWSRLLRLNDLSDTTGSIFELTAAAAR
jgi:2-methylcitrate dehydratase PrpD